MRKSYRYRIYPTKSQRSTLDLNLELCRQVYNDTLALRKNAYEKDGRSISLYETNSILVTWKSERQELRQVYSQVLQNAQVRVDLAFKAFFRRVKAGEEPGYPRFKGRGWYKSFTYPQAGFKLEGSRLTLSKIDSIRVFKHRAIEGKIKTCTVKRDKLGHWYAILVAEVNDVPKIEPKTAIGVDVGLKSLVALSTGETIQYPKYYIKTEQKLAVAQRDLSRKKKGSSNRQKAKIKVAKIHHKIQNHRDEFLHQVSRKIAD